MDHLDYLTTLAIPAAYPPLADLDQIGVEIVEVEVETTDAKGKRVELWSWAVEG